MSTSLVPLEYQVYDLQMPRKIRQLKGNLRRADAAQISAAMNEQPHYSMLIEWSDEDEAYLVTLPEWADSVLMPVTHGDTYDEAVKHGQEVLEVLIDGAREHDDPLPPPRTFAASAS